MNAASRKRTPEPSKCFCGLEHLPGETHTAKACVGPGDRITREFVAKRRERS